MIVSHTENPCRLLEAAFLRIQRESMADVPILNPALRVEALGFDRWHGHWLGILVTPWCMNLILLPHTPTDWTRIAAHARLFYHFPAGDFAFLCGDQPELGEYHSCALYSPMAQFQDQESARAVATEALSALMRSPDKPAVEPAARHHAAQSNPPDPAHAVDSQATPGMTKRDFFSKIFPRIPP